MRWDDGAVTDPWAKRTGLTAVLVAVPELTEYTDRWRTVSSSSSRPDVPLSELISPHVTVLVPWIKDPTPEDVQRLIASVAAVDPFELSFPTAGQFPNGTVWLRPEPFDEVRDLIRSVLAAFPECPAYGGEYPDPHPHLTISSSRQSGVQVLAEARAALASEAAPTVRLDDLTIWREGDDQVWQLIGSVPLGAR